MECEEKQTYLNMQSNLVGISIEQKGKIITRSNLGCFAVFKLKYSSASLQKKKKNIEHFHLFIKRVSGESPEAADFY